MTTAQDLQREALKLIHAARAKWDQYPENRHGGKAIPADAAVEVEQMLAKAADLQRKARLGVAIDDLAEPQYKHDMSIGHFPDGEELSQQTKSFLDYVRTGNQDIMRKAALVEDATGLNLVPVDYAGTIVKAMSREGVFRRLAFVKPTKRETVDVGNVSVGKPTWGRLETGATPADGLAASPADRDTIKVHELTALAKVGVDELADSDDNLAEIVRQALAEAFAEVEDDAFAGGDGVDKPFGIAASTANPITNLVTAAADNMPQADDLKALTYKVPARARRNGAVFVGHGGVEAKIALVKDNDGRYIFQPSAAEGENGTLFGFKWHTADGLPDPATAGVGEKSVVFGDVRAGYMIADRQRLTVQVLRELYAPEGKVGLLVKERVGGDVIRPSVLAAYVL